METLPAELPLFCLHRFEVSNAFLAYAFGAASGGEFRISTEWALSVRGKLWDVMKAETHPFLQVVLSPTDLWAQFDDLSLRHTAKRGCRAYGLLHVSAAILLKSPEAYKELMISFGQSPSAADALLDMFAFLANHDTSPISADRTRTPTVSRIG